MKNRHGIWVCCLLTALVLFAPPATAATKSTVVVPPLASVVLPPETFTIAGRLAGASALAGDGRFLWAITLEVEGQMYDLYTRGLCSFLDERGKEIPAPDFFRIFREKVIALDFYEIGGDVPKNVVVECRGSGR
ncbi:MAG: hypothetical protein LBQ42_00950 [Synergistaceae bacterium]|jgi:hypothetical protein|nr:hypothetical protein [Synergistaceae bacterium]